MKKKFLYAYRILLGLCIIAGITFLLSEAFIWLLDWFVHLYPPYTGWAAILAVVALIIFAAVVDIRASRRHKKEQALREAAKASPPRDFWKETEEMVKRCLSRYPYEVEENDGYYTVQLKNPEYNIYINLGNLWIHTAYYLSGEDEATYEGDTLEELESEFLRDMDNILNDRQVQVSFFTADDRLCHSFFCEPNEVDECIQYNLPIFTRNPLWSCVLRVIFLFPQKKPIKEIRIASANGIYDRIIPVKQ